MVVSVKEEGSGRGQAWRVALMMAGERDDRPREEEKGREGQHYMRGTDEGGRLQAGAKG
jgi:hypothetical protein